MTKDKSTTKKLLSKYVAILQALDIIHHSGHWMSKGNEFYGDHLLLQRIYEDTEDNMDAAAEKLLGIVDNFSTVEMAQTIQKFISELTEEDVMARSLEGELAFLLYSEHMYNEIEKANEMTLGLDDMIMSIANKHEEHVYLLKRRSFG